MERNQSTRKRQQVRNVIFLAGRQFTIELGACLASHGIKIVFGGSGFGLLGVMANAARDSGGKTLGIVPELFISEYCVVTC